MGRRGNARLDPSRRRARGDCHDDRIDRTRRGFVGASAGARRACRRSRSFRCRSHRQGENLPAGFSLLCLRGAKPPVEPPGDRHRARGRKRRNRSSGPRTLASPGDAAFANATMGHGLVREDMHAASICHHGVVIWPTLLALSERTPLSGATFLAAAIIGYETGAQIGRALFTADLARLYRPTGLVAPLGAALAGSYALGLTEDAATSAIAIAANTSSGLNEWPRAGGSEMYFHPGFAARNAIAAIELAEAGARASETILEGEAGLFAAFRRQPAPSEIRLFAGAAAGDHGRLQQAGSRLQFCANRGAGSPARRARTRDIGRHRDRFDPGPGSGGPLPRLRFQGAISQRAAGQDEHSLQRRRRAGARCARRRQLRAMSTIPGYSASSNGPICKARLISPPHSRPTRAPRSSLACATEKPSISASTMSLPRRRRKSAPAFGRLLPTSSATSAHGIWKSWSIIAHRFRTAASSPPGAGLNRPNNGCGQRHDR